jgi:hypothetical protein
MSGCAGLEDMAFEGDWPMTRTSRWKKSLLAVAGSGALFTSLATAGPQHSVVELFTSQGCSSCPPADALVGRLTADPALLVLSYHVTYWDNLGWKDSFSSRPSTDRQYQYARTLRQPSVFTPQLIVNGKLSVVGSQVNDVRKALAGADETALPVQAELQKQPDGAFNLVLTGPAVKADVWEVRYVRHAVTKINAGENGGRSLETFNNVTHLRKIGAFEPGTIKLSALKQPDDGVAVIVQKPSAGEIIGAVASE